VFNEEHIEYGPYSVGDIVFVKRYKNSNGVTVYDHFFVIVSQNNMAVPIESYGVLLSPTLEKLKYMSNILLPQDE